MAFFVKKLSDCKEEKRDLDAMVLDEVISPVRKVIQWLKKKKKIL